MATIACTLDVVHAFPPVSTTVLRGRQCYCLVLYMNASEAKVIYLVSMLDPEVEHV